MTGMAHDPVRITGYFPGIVGKIVALHATYYFDHWGLDRSFETQVGMELSEFVREFKEGRDGLWVAIAGSELAGCIAIDGRKARGEGARLRWFIVAPAFQRAGIGRLLLGEALDFCRSARFPRVFLWTFRGLDRARALYEEAGFHLREEHSVEQWGRTIAEQLFLLEGNADLPLDKGGGTKA